MTIIAYRDGVMAADTASFAGPVLTLHTRKIGRSPGGHLGASCGLSSASQEFRRWIEAGAEGEFKPSVAVGNDDFYGLLFDPSGQAVFIDHSGARLYADPAPWHAIGSPSEMAFGAMAAGACAEEAVAICIKYHTYCGGEIQVERLL